jgi:hypothetical protein
MSMVSNGGRQCVTSLVSRLVPLAEDCGLLPNEIEALISVHGGTWPITPARCDLWWPTEAQAERVRMLLELCVSVLTLMGPNARAWMRQVNAGLDDTPVRYVLSRPEALTELRDVLRSELGGC